MSVHAGRLRLYAGLCFRSLVVFQYVLEEFSYIPVYAGGVPVYAGIGLRSKVICRYVLEKYDYMRGYMTEEYDFMPKQSDYMLEKL